MWKFALTLCIFTWFISAKSPDECPETCGTIPNSYCDSVNDCGYVQIKSKAGYVGKFCVNGEDTSDKKNQKQFCCSSVNFAAGVARSVKFPCMSEKLVVTVEDEVAVNDWSTVGVVKAKNSSVDICYEIAGTTTKPTITPINCSVNATVVQ
eukprot:227672_1